MSNADQKLTPHQSSALQIRNSLRAMTCRWYATTNPIKSKGLRLPLRPVDQNKCDECGRSLSGKCRSTAFCDDCSKQVALLTKQLEVDNCDCSCHDAEDDADDDADDERNCSECGCSDLTASANPKVYSDCDCE
jgi:hypothetical protein